MNFKLRNFKQASGKVEKAVNGKSGFQFRDEFKPTRNLGMVLNFLLELYDVARQDH